MILAQDGILIRRWEAEYRIPRRHPAPDALKGRLDGALQRLARETLDAALSPLLTASSGSVWLIRRLELDLATRAGGDAGQNAASWAGQIARQLARVIQGGPDGENVLFFPDWAAYLAHFLGDLAEERAWGRWYYHAFAGLRHLPVSTAARTALLEDPVVGWAALQRLAEPRLLTMVAALTRQDAARVLDGLSGGPPAEVDEGALLAVCQRLAGRYALGAERLALLAALVVSRELGHPGGPQLAAAARLAAQLQAQAAPASDPAPSRRYTPFGGVFLLLPGLDRLPLADILANFPSPPGEDRHAALRLLLLALCGGPERAAAIFADPLVRDLAGVGPRFSTASAAGWLRGAGPRAWQRFNRALASGSWDGPAEGIGLLKAGAAGGAVLLALGLDSGEWRALARYTTRGGHWRVLERALGPLDLASWPVDPRLLAEAAAREGRASPLPPGGMTAQAQADLLYLYPPAGWRFPPSAGLALALAAQRLMRLFSRGVSGFERSGMDYLYRQFLHCSAGLEETGGQFSIHLAPPPLALVLRRAGMLRLSYRPAWLERRIELYPEA